MVSKLSTAAVARRSIGALTLPFAFVMKEKTYDEKGYANAREC